MALVVPVALGAAQSANATAPSPHPQSARAAADAAARAVAGRTARQIAAADSGAATSKRPDYSTTVLTVDNKPTGALGGPAGSMTFDQLAALAPHTGKGVPRHSSNTPALSAAPAGQDDMTVDECRKHDAAFSGQGWGKSRFVSCQAHGLHFLRIDCWFWDIGCRVTGAADVDVTDIQYTQNVGRVADVLQVFNNWFVWRKMNSQVMSSNVACDAERNSGACQPGVFSGPYTATLGEMSHENGGTASRFYDFTQPESAGWGPDKLSYASLSWHFKVDDAEPDHADGPKSQFRCDSATYIVNTNASVGCVFPWVTETMQFSVQQSKTAAQHILTALYHTDQTLPEKSGKVIPGKPGTSPLHRTTNASLINSHRDVAIPTCQFYWPGYPSNGLECDEFPFASTLEGATLDDNFSVEAIPGADNSSGGGVMNAFYSYRRIIGDDTDKVNDPFFVDVGF
ncbi:NucA/NucB deoxyribonuclease domain-containing protein [Streptomyces sp. NBC_01431]|uniref:NucA/NucB deoxyribonuclease domain-containing protein n=1 Tax=Streptomyces sp. NBC_01431 TaxID=2903863 RepID=UPI002E32FD0F|nr:NucA/NucB deoxyribonuclease domain-containing protein [Streptomyces sp. NBC_01431]